MVHKTLGGWGKGLSWIVYLLLLYSLTAAYISASSPLFVSAVRYVTGYTMPDWLGPFCLPLIFGFFCLLRHAGCRCDQSDINVGALCVVSATCRFFTRAY